MGSKNENIKRARNTSVNITRMVFGVEYFSYEFQCTWSEYEIAHGLDRPWMCHMPDIIGFIAVFIGIAMMSYSTFNFVRYVRTHAAVSFMPISTDGDTTGSTRLSSCTQYYDNE